MANYEAEIPTTVELFDWRWQELSKSLSWQWDEFGISFMYFGPVQARAVISWRRWEDRPAGHYRIERYHDHASWVVNMSVIQFVNDACVVDVQYDPAEEEAALFVANLVDWLRRYFKAKDTALRPDLSNQIEWLLHCRRREYAKVEMDTSYGEFDAEHNRDTDVAGRWAAKFRRLGLL